MKKLILPVLIILLYSGCSLGVDWAGFFYSGSTPDSRFEESESLNHHSDPSSLASLPLTGGKYVYSIAAIADIHVRDVNVPHLTEFIDDYISADDLFILDCGDSTNSGTAEQFQIYRSLMDGSGLPWFAAIGNHDLYFEGWFSYRDIIGKSAYSFQVGSEGNPGSLYVVALDSANGTLGRQQMLWLEELLSAQKGKWDHLVVFTHCQFFSTGNNTVVQFTDTEEIYKLMHLFRENGVDLVLSGHNHVWDDRYIEGVQYLTLEPLQKQGSGDSFVRISVDGSMLSWEKVVIPD